MDLVSFMECLLEKLCCRFGKKRFFVERKATVQGLVVGGGRCIGIRARCFYWQLGFGGDGGRGTVEG